MSTSLTPDIQSTNSAIAAKLQYATIIQLHHTMVAIAIIKFIEKIHPKLELLRSHLATLAYKLVDLVLTLHIGACMIVHFLTQTVDTKGQ